MFAVSGRTDESGDAPSHRVKTGCITAEVPFHDKAFRTLTLGLFQSGTPSWQKCLERLQEKKKKKNPARFIESLLKAPAREIDARNLDRVYTQRVYLNILV